MANALKHVGWVRGAMNSIAYCPFCDKGKQFIVRVPRGRKGVGRGNGFASSSAARAKVVAHIKEKHANKITPQVPNGERDNG